LLASSKKRKVSGRHYQKPTLVRIRFIHYQDKSVR
jgi:hypothetical protein